MNGSLGSLHLDGPTDDRQTSFEEVEEIESAEPE